MAESDEQMASGEGGLTAAPADGVKPASPGAVDPSYPAHWEADVLLRDGSAAHIRPMRVDDRQRLEDLHNQLSEETIYFRFFAPYPTLSRRDLDRFTDVDHDERVALVVTVADEIVSVVRYDRVRPGAEEAEVAFVVRDDFQGYGLGSILLEHLAVAARERGVTRFVADVLPTNHRMLQVFADAGYAPRTEIEEGVVRLEFAIRPTASSRAVADGREHRAEARSIERLLAPDSVVLVGASRREASVGKVLLHNLVDGGFTGRLYAVNPEATEDLLGVPTFASVRDIPERVDVAIVATPADSVLDVVADCAARGVHALVVVSGGFADAGEDGRALQGQLVDAAHAVGMRVVGPNCLGLINADPAVRLNASLSPILPRRGRLGFFSQSGPLGVALLETMDRVGLGVSTFVSAGNRADVSGNDLMQFWEEDDATDALLLYMESIGNPRKFTRIARRTSRVKPIVAVKSGRSTQGVPLGHKVRPTTLPATAVDEMFRQSGVIQVETLSEMFDVAGLLSFQPLPAGRRVAVVGNSDALGVMANDACVGRGLIQTGPSEALWPATPAADFGAELQTVVTSADVDAVIVVFVPSVGTSPDDYADEILRVSRHTDKPLVAIVMAADGMRERLLAPGEGEDPATGCVPTFGSVEDAVRALAAVIDYADWRSRPDGHVPELEDVDRVAARALIKEVLARHPSGAELTPDEIEELLGCYGIELWSAVSVHSVDEAVHAARELGYPVVLKAINRTLVHRSDLGGIRLDLMNDGDVAWAFEAMVQDFGPAVADGLMVQRMSKHGVSCVIETSEDDLFGPIVSFRLGGVVTELVEDRGYGIPPLTDVDAHELVRAPRAAPLLLGHRGGPALDTDVLEDLIVRASQLSDDVPELVHLELNPVVVTSNGTAVLSASARVSAALVRADTGARQLPKG